jgi:myo-inositol 2-dehydrogenase/D-chiro-inositol 1-dehydrogenase
LAVGSGYPKGEGFGEAAVVRFAMLGCGRIGRMHAGNIHAHSRARLVACFDVAPEAARRVASECGAVALGSAEAAIAREDVDAVFIASSTATHVDLITLAAGAGKAILCEKPIDLDIGRVDSCWAAIGGRAPLLMLGFNRRFDPSFRALRDRLHAGEIGRLEQLVITSRDPAPPPPAYVAGSGGLFRDMTIHDFDMARFLAGEIVAVQAMGANLIDPAIGAQGDIDAAMVLLRAASGALIHINNSRRCAYGYDQRIEAFGATGMLQAHNRHPTTVERWGRESTRAMDAVQDFFIARYQEAYMAELDHFVDCVENRSAPLAGFAEGREALRLADAALESLRRGREVEL